MKYGQTSKICNRKILNGTSVATTQNFPYFLAINFEWLLKNMGKNLEYLFRVILSIYQLSNVQLRVAKQI